VKVIYDIDLGLIVGNFFGLISIFEPMEFALSWQSTTEQRQQQIPSMRKLETITICALDYSKRTKLIATGGVEGRLVLIDPGAKIVTNHVKAHSKNILDVYFYDSQY
jgi:hypothetical protein